jgi:hypothetical protein
MKKLFVLYMLIPLAIVSSCQKQDSTAEQQLAQRKTELDAREKALDEREKALAEREQAAGNAQISAAKLQQALSRSRSGNPSAPSIPPGLVPTAPNTAQLKAERERRIQERIGQRQRRLDVLQKMRTLGVEASPATETSPGGEATSPSPSPTPQ